VAGPIATLRALALRHAGVTEGIACAGTPLERRTMKTGIKAFLFAGATDAMVKLAASLPEARRLAKAEPARYRVGANGWVKLTFTAAEPPARDVLARWIAESYQLMSAAEQPAVKPAKKKSR
jgi:hypothetical protein